MSPPSRASAARPDVSFLVAARNVAPFIEDAIRSALAQEACSIEVIVVDDQSSDSGPDIVQALAAADDRIRLLRRTVAGGASAARNDAIAAARGAWLAVLDGDDLIEPGRSRFLLDLAATTSADIVADNVTRFGEGLAPRTEVPRGTLPYGIALDVPTYVEANCPMRRGINLGYLKPMFRRDFFERHALRYETRLRIAEDYLLCLAALLAGGRFVIASEPFYRYRVRAGSLSWRLTVEDIDLLAGAQTAALAGRLAEAPMAWRLAATRFDKAIRRARAIEGAVAAARAGDVSHALGMVAARPDTWGFLADVALRFARRRIGWGRPPAGVPA